jgi:hypothetical protein
MNKIIVLGHSKPYDFLTDNKERLMGAKVTFINSIPNQEDGVRGFLPLQLTVDPLILDDLKELPGIYDVEYTMRPGKNNMPVATISSFKLVKPFKIELI